MGIIHNMLFYKRDAIVKQYSENYKRLLDINNKYNFENISNKMIIEENEFSLKSFNDILAKQIITYHIENNLNNIRNWIETAEKNQELYNDYINEINTLNYQTPIDLINKTGYDSKKFYSIEKSIIKNSIIKEDIYNIKAHVFVYLVNRNYDIKNRKDRVVYYDELLSIYDEWKNSKKYYETTKKERKLMNNTLRDQVLKRDGYRCKVCGKTPDDGVRLEIDHIIPVSKGGQTTMSNLQTLCSSCNYKKCAQDNQTFILNESRNQLKNKLLSFRKKRSKEMNIPAYYVFTNDELEKLLNLSPKTIEELKETKILSNIKVKTHGKEIIEIINKQ